MKAVYLNVIYVLYHVPKLNSSDSFLFIGPQTPSMIEIHSVFVEI